ncbi:MAG TPA: hypothetical protein VK338_06535, partial [Candidatus Nitrosocosmicus sp.]|nr:hypothetical protein [Candidatus Nitrosocosmicus sp.]
IKVSTLNKEEITLTIVKETKIQLLDSKSLTISASTLAKMKEGDTIHFIAKKPAEEKITKANADKILTIPQEYFIVPSNTPTQ